MSNIKENGDYIAVRVPEGAHRFDTCLPYSNQIKFLSGHPEKFESSDGKRSIELETFQFIEVPQILPNTGIRYKILGLISDIMNKYPLIWIILEIPPKELNQWLLIKKGKD